MSGAWDRIEGFRALADWFGGVPSFHDGYVLGLKLEFPGVAELSLHGWAMTDRVDDRGYFELEKHFVATFRLTGVSALQLEDFDEGAILMGLGVREEAGLIQLDLDPVIGVGGFLRAKDISVTFVPGKPAR